MGDIEKNLEDADDHIERAENLLEEVAMEAVEIARENTEIISDFDSRAMEVQVKVDHDDTIHRLNENLPIPYFATVEEGNVEIRKLDLNIDELQSENDLVKVKEITSILEDTTSEGAPVPKVIEYSSALGMTVEETEEALDKLKQKGEVYEPSTDYLRTT
ncbi:hypothetical protein [Halosolutus gelatinilyticus]|uniref:hypothetical protein n=1 Tax=Halosolutus gelatinilyticus TaxID=2931975 RepID=UPI001FF14A47|nr:hypothetical protein [Halosolutus gelatinilyticus]